MKNLNKLFLLLSIPGMLWIAQGCQDSTEAGLGQNDAAIGEGGNTSGIGGSLNQFVIAGPNENYLYSGYQNTITVFDISNANEAQPVNELQTSSEIETVHNMGDHLYLGTPVGMIVYDITDPANPSYVSEFQHVRSCDPVVASGNYAYVTLRGGSECGGMTNELQVLDISDKSAPFLVHQYNVSAPYGLGIDNGLLFVCDGEEGLKVYDATNPEGGLNLVTTFKRVKAYDVIPVNGLLILKGDNELRQYKYNGPESIEEISTLKL